MYFYINKSDPGGRFHKHTFIFIYIFFRVGYVLDILANLNELIKTCYLYHEKHDHVLIWRNFGWGTPAKMFFSC